MESTKANHVQTESGMGVATGSEGKEEMLVKEHQLSVMRLALPGGLTYTLVIAVNQTLSYDGKGLSECI